MSSGYQLIPVSDLERSQNFYINVLGEQPLRKDDCREIVFCKKFALQSLASWIRMLGARHNDPAYYGQKVKLSLEKDQFKKLTKRLNCIDELCIIHGPSNTYAGGEETLNSLPGRDVSDSKALRLRHAPSGHGQLSVRFFDPDGHIIEIVESIAQPEEVSECLNYEHLGKI